jgi:hypothetical protein
LAWKRAELTWTWSLPSRETAREEVFWFLAVLVIVLLMRFFSTGLRLSFHPWAKAGPLKGPRIRWTGIPRYPEHRQDQLGFKGDLVEGRDRCSLNRRSNEEGLTKTNRDLRKDDED